jgi:uncharacterized membrane protein
MLLDVEANIRDVPSLFPFSTSIDSNEEKKNLEMFLLFQVIVLSYLLPKKIDAISQHKSNNHMKDKSCG